MHDKSYLKNGSKARSATHLGSWKYCMSRLKKTKCTVSLQLSEIISMRAFTSWVNLAQERAVTIKWHTAQTVLAALSSYCVPISTNSTETPIQGITNPELWILDMD